MTNIRTPLSWPDEANALRNLSAVWSQYTAPDDEFPHGSFLQLVKNEFLCAPHIWQMRHKSPEIYPLTMQINTQILAPVIKVHENHAPCNKKSDLSKYYQTKASRHVTPIKRRLLNCG